jgi:pilus assembly protein Flp/PilA
MKFQFINDADGASAVEYALLIAMIALVIITGVTTLGVTLSGVYSNMAGKL